MWFARACYILVGLAFFWLPLMELTRAIRTGVLRTRSGFLVPRADGPVSFWIGFAIYAFTVLMGIVLSVSGIAGQFDKRP